MYLHIGSLFLIEFADPVVPAPGGHFSAHVPALEHDGSAVRPVEQSEKLRHALPNEQQRCQRRRYFLLLVPDMPCFVKASLNPVDTYIHSCCTHAPYSTLQQRLFVPLQLCTRPSLRPSLRKPGKCACAEVSLPRRAAPRTRLPPRRPNCRPRTAPPSGKATTGMCSGCSR